MVYRRSNISRMIGMGMKHRGLGKIQRSQRSNTDWKVYECLAWCKAHDKQVWFTKLQYVLEIDNTTLRKSLNRLLKNKEIKEFKLQSVIESTHQMQHTVFFKGYEICKPLL